MRFIQLLAALGIATVSAAEPAAPAAKPPETDRPVAIHGKLEPAQALFRSQLLGELDHAVGDHLAIAGQTIPARLDAKGDLELDLKGDGKFTAYSRPTTVTVSIPQDGGKRTAKLQLYLGRAADKTWTYRTATQLSLQVGQDGLCVVDVNGDGVFNEPGVDGLCWAGSEWVFPLPAADERWCTPGLDLTGLAFGPLGEDPHVAGRVLATTRPEALPVLIGVNRERVKLGLAPRPEDVSLSADLQAHCHYMAVNKQLTHPEDSGKPAYTSAGNSAGMRSILGMGTAAENLGTEMVGTYFHRQDVIRPETLAFGVGYEGSYGGIDGRTRVGHAPAGWWPVLCPVPDQRDVPTNFNKEMPDPIPGHDRAGFPITVYFGTNRLKLTGHSLKAVAGSGSKNPAPLDCFEYDPQTGASANMTGYQRCVALIAKDPLQDATIYEVMFQVDVDGKPWTRTWQFSTVGMAKAKR